MAEDIGCYCRYKFSNELRQVVCCLLGNNDLKESFVIKGKFRLEDFSWKKSAQQTVQVYDEVLKKL